MKFDLDRLQYRKWSGGITLTLKLKVAQGWDVGEWDEFRNWDEVPQDKINIAIADKQVSITFEE